MELRSGYSFHVLTDADDLTQVSETLKGLQAMLDTAGIVATWAGRKFDRGIVPLYTYVLTAQDAGPYPLSSTYRKGSQPTFPK
jgi:hypothetical protein